MPRDQNEVRRLFDESTRGKLLYAGLLCFTEIGYGGVTVSMIASRAGLSKQIAIYHFKTPDIILIELVKFWGDVGRQVTIEHLASLLTSDPIEKLVGMSNGMFLFLQKYPELGKLTPVIFQAAQNSTEITKAHTPTLKTGQERIKSFLLQCPQFEKARGQELQRAVIGLHSLMYGAILYAIGTNCWENITDLQEATNSSIRSAVRGYERTGSEKKTKA